MSNNLQLKIDNLLTLTRTGDVLRDKFMLLQDHDGWSNGYIADLTPINVAVMQAKATFKYNKRQTFQLRTNKTLSPKIQPLLDKQKKDIYKDIDNVSLDLLTLHATIITGESTTVLDPIFMKYFQDTYKKLGTVTYKICISHKLEPVTVCLNDNIVGFIMPILS